MIQASLAIPVFPKGPRRAAHIHTERLQIFCQKPTVLHIHKHVHSEIKSYKRILGTELIFAGDKAFEIVNDVIL